MKINPYPQNLCFRIAIRSLLPGILSLAMVLMPSIGLHAQQPEAKFSPVATAATAPSVVRWTGSLPEAAGRTVELQFALYQDQAGGLALWNETHMVQVGADGRYTVLLGAASAEGLPQTLFQSGDARWLQVLPIPQAGPNGTEATTAAAAPARSLLAAAPYAFESVDAETLAGRAAADYVTREDLQSAVAANMQTALQTQPQVSPTGSGTADYVPLWTGTGTLGNSVIAESGANVGVGTATPATKLDVNGAATVRGDVTLPAVAATATAGVNSHALELEASAYSSNSDAAVEQNFAWQALTSGNNTASPSANLKLLFGSGAAAPAATGLSIAPNGQITFAAGQTFPGTGAGTITGVTASSPLTGGGAKGSISLGLNTASLETTLNSVYARLGAANTFTRPITFAAGQTFPGTGAGTITGVTAGTALTGGGATGAVTLNLDATKVPLLATSNTFTGANTFTKPITFVAGQTFPGAGTITGVTAGTALTGGGATGAVTLNLDTAKVPLLATPNSFTGTNTFSKPIIFAAGQTFPGTGAGTITGVTASSPLTGGGTSGAVSLGLNTASLETTLNGVYPQLDANNTFSGSNKFSRPVTFAAGQTFPGSGGTITGVTAGQGLTGGGASGAVTLTVDNTQIPYLNLDNTYQGVATFMNGVSAQNGITTNLIEVASSQPATSTAPGPSGVAEIGTSSYNSNTAAAVEQNFAWTAIPDANNTANPTSELDLQFSSGFAQPASTGLSIAPSGIITFASGQTFPSAGSITGVTAGTGLTGGGTSGNVTLNVDPTKVPLLSAANSFTGAGSFSANVNVLGLGGALGATNTNTSGGSGLVASGYSGVVATGVGTGVSATATGASGTGLNATGSHYGVLATSALGTGVFGQSNGGSAIGGSYASYQAGVWGDSGAEMVGVLGTSNLGYGGLFANDSPTTPTLWVKAWGASEAGVFYNNGANSPAVYASNGGGPGISAIGTSTGLSATASSGNGVYGTTSATGGPAGVYGNSTTISVGGDGFPGIGVSGNAQGPNAWGVYGYSTGSSGTGVYGNSPAGQGGKGVFGTGDTGVWGFTTGTSGSGVRGDGAATGVQGNATGSNGIGVSGSAPNIGVQGNASSYGVYGTGTASNGIGVYGTAPDFGLYGLSTGGDNTVGVYGQGGYGMQAGGTQYGIYSATFAGSNSVAGTYGLYGGPSNTGQGTMTVPVDNPLSFDWTEAVESRAGVWADTNFNATTGYNGTVSTYTVVPALLATADENTAAAIINSAGYAPGYPALLVGNLASGAGINAAPVLLATGHGGNCTMSTHGDTSCTGELKSRVGATTASGATQVETYSVQAAENWFEDAGTVQLANGVARVNLEPLFGQTVNTGIEYHVFLTPDGDCKGLYVSNKTATGFEVRELGGGRSSIAFEYRIMAKRIGHENERLVEVKPPISRSLAAMANGNGSQDTPRLNTRPNLPHGPVVVRQPQLLEPLPQPALAQPVVPEPVHPRAAQPAPAKPLSPLNKDVPARPQKPATHS